MLTPVSYCGNLVGAEGFEPPAFLVFLIYSQALLHRRSRTPIWHQGLDLNQRGLSPTVLETAAFNHLATLM